MEYFVVFCYEIGSCCIGSVYTIIIGVFGVLFVDESNPFFCYIGLEVIYFVSGSDLELVLVDQFGWFVDDFQM